MNIQEIKDFPTCIGNNHESTLQSYQLLNKVKEMLERGDSKETILEVIDFVKTPNKLQENHTCDHIWTAGSNGSDRGDRFAVCAKCGCSPGGSRKYTMSTNDIPNQSHSCRTRTT